MPPCSMIAKWKPAVLAIACRWSGRSQVGVVSRNGWKLPCDQTRDGLRECVSEIGVLVIAAVARPPTRVHGKLHEIGEPSDLLGAGRLTARQSAKLVQIDGLGPFRSQIGIEELKVGDLIVGVVMDVLVHVLIQHLNGRGVGRIPGPAGDFGVLDSAEFVVLLPQIGFDDFCAARNRRMAASPRVRPPLEFGSLTWAARVSAKVRRPWFLLPRRLICLKRNGG